MKVLVELPHSQISRLSDLCAHESRSRSDVIRAAIEAYLEQHKPARAEDIFGILPQLPDGLAYEDALREEWSRS